MAVILGFTAPLTAQPQPSADEVNGERVLRHVHVLAEDIGPRRASTARARKAAAYIISQLESVGLQPERMVVGVVDTPAVNVGPLKFLRAVQIYSSDANVVVRFKAEKPQAGKAILVMAHYDTVPGSPGAVDNATSVGILLELARVLARAPPPRPIILAFTAAEELRLAGARKLASTIADEVGLAVSMDLIGTSETVTLNGLSSLLGRRWLEFLAAVARKADVPVRAPMPHRVVSRLLPQLERSDHGAFTERGVPAFHLYNRTLYLPYHMPFDTTDRVVTAAATNTGAFLVELTRTPGPLPESGGDQGFWLPFSDTPRVVRALTAWIVEIIAILFVVASIVMVVRRKREPAKGVGLALVLPAYLAGWLVATVALKLGQTLTLHPSPWIHAPLRYVIATAAIAASAGAGAAWLARTRWSLIGVHRYLLAALSLPLLAGITLLAVGAHEVAWIPLTGACSLAAMHWARARWSAAVWLAFATIPAASVLEPGFLREAVFHGFLPTSLPLSLFAAVALLYPTLAAVYLTRRWPLPAITAKRSRIAVASAVGLVAVAATLTLLVPGTACEPSIYSAYGISCESAPGVSMLE